MSERSGADGLGAYLRRVAAGLFRSSRTRQSPGETAQPAPSDGAWRRAYKRSLEQGNTAQAESILSARLRTAPSDFDAAALLCRHYQDRGEPQRAEQLLRQYLRGSPRHVPARTLLAQALWRSGGTDQAVRELRGVLDADSRQAKAWQMLVGWHIHLGQYDEARTATRQWLHAVPGSGQAEYHMGRVLRLLGLTEGALTHLERAARHGDAAIDAGLEMVQARLQMKEVEVALRETRRCLAEFARFEPRHVSAVIGLARQWHAHGEFQAVVDCCDAVQDRRPDDPLLLALKASSLKQLGRTAESEELAARCHEFLRSDRGTTADPAQIARALWLLERFDEALERLREKLRTEPDSEPTWRILVRSLEKLERGEESLAAARSWLAAMPGSAQANWHVARLLIRDGNLEEARVFIDRALAHTTAAVEPGLEVARALLAAKHAEPAAELTERLLAAPERIAARSAGPIMMLAGEFHVLRKYSAAEQCCRAIARFRGDDPAFLALHGHVLLSKGEFGRAREVLERAVFLSPESEKAPRLQLALSCLQQGDTELGRAYLSEAVGFEEEGAAFAALFGNAALAIPHFGIEIDRHLAAEKVIAAPAVTSWQGPDFDVGPADLVATAHLLLSRKPQLENLVNRKNNVDIPGLRRHGFSTCDDAERALARINAVAGNLLKQAVAMKEDDPVALKLLAGLYRERGEHEAALACDRQVIGAAPDDDEAKIGAVKSLLALGRFDEAVDAAAVAKGIPREGLECIRLLPFREWGESAGEVSAVNHAEPFAHQFTAIHDGRVVPVDYAVDQWPLSVVQARDLTVMSGYIPVKNGTGYVFELGMDVLDWHSTVAGKDAFIRKVNVESRVIEEPCIYLTGALWHYENYYHALAQNFPRLALLLDRPEYAGHKIAVPTGLRPWNLDFLKEMGVPAERLEFLSGKENALFRRVVVPAMRRTASRDEIQSLRRRLDAHTRQRGTRRFFIGRSSLAANPRLLVNEQEIAAIAAEHGFEEVDTAGLTIRQQIDLFGEAAAICGPNGAAFGNLIHAPDGTTVICLSIQETVGMWYSDLAGLCNQPFYLCFGNVLPEGRSSRWLPWVPYFINPDDFRKSLEIALGAGKS